MIFAQSQSSVGSRPDCAGAKFALSSNSSAPTRNPKFIAGFFCSSPPLLLLLPSRAEPPIVVRNLRRRRRNPPPPARLESVSASPIPPSRRSTSGVPTRSSSRGADANLDNPLQAMGELRAAVFDRHATGVGHSLGSAADRGRAASWAPRAGGLGSPTVETWEGWEREWGRIISTMP